MILAIRLCIPLKIIESKSLTDQAACGFPGRVPMVGQDRKRMNIRAADRAGGRPFFQSTVLLYSPGFGKTVIGRIGNGFTIDPGGRIEQGWFDAIAAHEVQHPPS